MLIGANVFIPSTSPWYPPYAGTVVRYTCFLPATIFEYAFEATFLHILGVHFENFLLVLAGEICKVLRDM